MPTSGAGGKRHALSSGKPLLMVHLPRGSAAGSPAAGSIVVGVAGIAPGSVPPLGVVGVGFDAMPPGVVGAAGAEGLAVPPAGAVGARPVLGVVLGVVGVAPGLVTGAALPAVAVVEVGAVGAGGLAGASLPHAASRQPSMHAGHEKVGFIEDLQEQLRCSDVCVAPADAPKCSGKGTRERVCNTKSTDWYSAF